MLGGNTSVIIVVCLLLGAFTPLIGSQEDANYTLNIAGQLAEPTIAFEANVPVRGTYLFADNDAAEWDDNGDGTKEKHYLEAPLIVNLAADGFKPGDKIQINASGEVHYMANVDWNIYWSGASELWGVFSSSQTLLWQNQGNEVGPLHRVPDAINAGEPFETWPTFNGYSTDIPEDFFVPESGTSIKIPQGAAYLMLSGSSSKFTDNDGWIKVIIENLDKDTDGDGLLDSWEKEGIDSDEDGDIDLVLTGADWQHKDIFVEVDYMDSCWPDPLAFNDVKLAFSKAPVSNPDGKNGINLHVLVDQKIDLELYTTWSDFDALKLRYFGTAEDQVSSNKAAILEARKQISHYCLFAYKFAVHNDTTNVTTLPGNSGSGELLGNDFMVTLGYTFESNPSYLGRMEQASTFMHELGHNLKLSHGGKDDINYKPNYLSIMNYMFQFNDLYPNRPLDFSRTELSTLNEAALNEMDGVEVDYASADNGGWLFTGYKDPIKNKTVLSLLRPIDWDGDNFYNTSVRANVNNCTDLEYKSRPDQMLDSYNDWDNIVLPFQNSKNFADGAHYDCPEEMTLEAMELMKEYAQNYHDVALINATTSSSVVNNDSILDVTVHSVNLGANNETTTLSIYAGTTLIAQRTIALERCNITTTLLRCDISNVPKGDQVITIRLAQVPGEEDAIDNNYTYGTIEFTGEAAPQDTGLSWPLVLGVSMALIVLAAIALVIILRRRGKEGT